jgi:hypothetical protein
VKDTGELDEFNDIQPALSGFYLRDYGMGAGQPFRQLPLAKARLYPLLHQELLKLLLLLGEQGLSHPRIVVVYRYGSESEP